MENFSYLHFNPLLTFRKIYLYDTFQLIFMLWSSLRSLDKYSNFYENEIPLTDYFTGLSSMFQYYNKVATVIFIWKFVFVWKEIYTNVLFHTVYFTSFLQYLKKKHTTASSCKIALIGFVLIMNELLIKLELSIFETTKHFYL